MLTIRQCGGTSEWWELAHNGFTAMTLARSDMQQLANTVSRVGFSPKLQTAARCAVVMMCPTGELCDMACADGTPCRKGKCA